MLGLIINEIQYFRPKKKGFELVDPKKMAHTKAFLQAFAIQLP